MESSDTSSSTSARTSTTVTISTAAPRTSTTTTQVTAVSALQGMMNSAVQAALPALQSSLATSLEQRLETSLRQQEEKINSLFGNFQANITGQGQTSGFSSACSIVNTPPSTSTARLPTGGSVPQQHDLANVPLIPPQQSSGAADPSRVGLTAATPLALLLHAVTGDGYE